MITKDFFRQKGITMKWLHLSLIFLLSITQIHAQEYRTETIGGKKFIIHKVSEKETLYSISRKYNVSIYTILEHNPSADAGLEIGQLLRVPYTERPAHEQTNNAANGTKIHVVNEKETLFAIARLYNVKPDEIKSWNNLQDNNIYPGQELMIKPGNAVPTFNSADYPDAKGRKLHQVSAGETMYGISRQYNISIQQLQQWNSMQSFEIKEGQVLIVSDYPGAEKYVQAAPDPVMADTTETQEEPVKVIQEPHTVIISENVKGAAEIREKGLAELIDTNEAGRKDLALHRTAPEGTLIKVRNEMNNREVWVKVVGKLPDTGENTKVIIKLSKSAYERLGAIDKRFLVELTYYK